MKYNVKPKIKGTNLNKNVEIGVLTENINASIIKYVPDIPDAIILNSSIFITKTPQKLFFEPLKTKTEYIIRFVIYKRRPHNKLHKTTRNNI